MNDSLKALFDATQAAQQKSVACHDAWRACEQKFAKRLGSSAEEVTRLWQEFDDANAEFHRMMNEYSEAAIRDVHRQRETPRNMRPLVAQ